MMEQEGYAMNQLKGLVVVRSGVVLLVGVVFSRIRPLKITSI